MARSIFDIFLSSTSEDLRECRARVRYMLDRMGQVAIRMESFGARPDKPLNVCRERVLSCDALVVIVGHRYGWVPAKTDGGNNEWSITRWEVYWALKSKKPVYAFLLDPTATWVGSREQDRLVGATTDTEILAIGKAVKRLLSFRQFLENKTTREIFTSPDDLAARLATSLHDWILKQKMQEVRAAHQHASRTLHLPSAGVGRTVPVAAGEDLYWKEQVHLLSGQQTAASEPVKIAVIAGRVDTSHPALKDLAIRHVDAHGADHRGQSDDYTTAVAGILGSVAPRCPLVIFTVLETTYSTSTAAIAAALEGSAVEGARVVCLTLNGPEQSSAMSEALRKITELGVIVVCAAGNESGSAASFPASDPAAVTFTAVTPDCRLAKFSNYGDWVAAAAPGCGLTVPVCNARYEKMSGTSISCAIGAGIVALMCTANPALHADNVREIIRSSGYPVLGAPGSSPLTVVDAYQSMERAVAFQKRAVVSTKPKTAKRVQRDAKQAIRSGAPSPDASPVRRRAMER